MAKDGSIVVTASGVHDPESPGGAQGISATLGDLRGLQTLGKQCEMMDGGAFNADKAYKDSKVRTTGSNQLIKWLTICFTHLTSCHTVCLSQLCNVLFTRELQRRLSNSDATKGIAVNCFNPGLIVGTGLFRDQNPVFTKLFDLAATNLFRVGESPEWGGAALEYMTRQHDTRGLFYTSPPGSSRYGDAAFGREFIPMPVSKEAQDDSKGKLLWDLSMQSLGLSAQSGNV